MSYKLEGKLSNLLTFVENFLINIEKGKKKEASTLKGVKSLIFHRCYDSYIKLTTQIDYEVVKLLAKEDLI